jgi:hypothetical protein
MSAAPETFYDDLLEAKRRMKVYNLRWTLARYPVDLVRHWWRVDGDLPYATSRHAYAAFKRGEKPGSLYRGAPHWPKLRVMRGGRS